MKKIILTAFLFLIIVYAAAAAYLQSVSSEFVRFHIIAESDSPYDQLVKMELRDYIFKIYSPELSKFETKEETLDFLLNNQEALEQTSNDFLKSIGYNKSVSVLIAKDNFPKKDYGDFILPFGRYDALKIKIGNGNGKNFFCVMFPPACISKEMTEEVSDILNSRKIIYKFKFF